jgi:hypothetical protein
MKAFDEVSHEAQEAIMTEMESPRIPEQQSLHTGQWGIFDKQSGTRQRCPLSPLLFTLIGEIFSQNILCNPKFQGMGYKWQSKKVAAYADDTAMLVSSEKDLETDLEVITDFKEATAMKVNNNSC